jgi:hypothetical protein
MENKALQSFLTDPSHKDELLCGCRLRILADLQKGYLHLSRDMKQTTFTHLVPSNQWKGSVKR